MLNKISDELKEKIKNFTSEDKIIFNNKVLDINHNYFIPITSVIKQENEIKNKTITFIDGGQAEIISAGNFCLSFIRIVGLIIRNNKKINNIKKEFYLLTTANYSDNELFYQSKIFGDKLVDEDDLYISSTDNTIRTGMERASISKVSNVARRFAELSMASCVNSDYVVLDGTLESTYKNEDKYLSRLNCNVCALAKSSSLFTTSGNSPIVLLNKLGPEGCWHYFLEHKSYFVKLHEKAKHVFRFEGNKDVLAELLDNCNDALFLGYPYSLILADRLARVGNQEKKSLQMRFLLSNENREIAEYLNTGNAHEILDNLG
ncbi:MAG: hypothetical protein ABH824_05270 [Nanoarchaeota archaeon]|nr:hypothetical protein [Nanoarchaeota archaeon]MBU1632806.1 hypothetical protein [Nanoarchaeota archaeon]MBU1876501.1 hypothetical protein [Nanoarchaeota archaeon]